MSAVAYRNLKFIHTENSLPTVMAMATETTTCGRLPDQHVPTRSVQAAELILFSPASTNCKNQLEVLN